MMKHFLIILLVALLSTLDVSGQVCYDRFMERGKEAMKNLNFERALKQFKAAEVCCETEGRSLCEAAKYIEEAQEGYLNEINKRTLDLLAVDLAYKSQDLLSEGKRTAAYRLAEYAQQLAPDHPKVHEALFNAVYWNVLPKPSDEELPILWSRSLEGHTDMVNFVEYSPDGKLLITASDDNTAKIWDATTETVLVTLKGHEDWVNMARFSNDGKKALTVSDDGSVRIWDVKTGVQLAGLFLSDAYFFSADFSPDGEKVITTDEDGNLLLWNVDGALADIFLTGSLELQNAYFTPDGEMIVTPENDGVIRLWSADNGLFLRRIVVNGFDQEAKDYGDSFFTSVDFCTDRRELLVATIKKEVHLYDLETGRRKLTIKDDEKPAGSMAKYIDSCRAVIIFEDGKAVKTYDIKKKNFTTRYKATQDMISSLSVSPLSDAFAIATFENSPTIWNAKDRQLVEYTGVSFSGYSIASPNRQFLVSQTSGSSAYSQLTNYSNRYYRGTQKLSVLELGVSEATKTWDVPGQPVLLVDFYSDDAFYYTLPNGEVWRVRAGQKKELVPISGSDVTMPFVIKGSPSGRYLFKSDYGMVSMYDWKAKQEVVVDTLHLKGMQRFISEIAVANAESFVAIGGDRGDINVITINDGAVGAVTSLQDVHKNGVLQLRFSADDQFLLSLGVSGKLKVHAVATGQLEFEIESYAQSILNFDLSPDGRYLLLLTGGGGLQVWDFQGRKKVVDLKKLNSALVRAWLTDNNNRVLGIDRWGVAREFPLSLDHLLKEGADLAGPIPPAELLRQDFAEVLDVARDTFLNRTDTQDDNWKVYGMLTINRAVVASDLEESIGWIKELENAKANIKDKRQVANLEESAAPVRYTLARKLFEKARFEEAIEMVKPLGEKGGLQRKDYLAPLCHLLLGHTDIGINGIYPTGILYPNNLEQDLNVLYANRQFCAQPGSDPKTCIPSKHLAPLQVFASLSEDQALNFELIPPITTRRPVAWDARLNADNAWLHKNLKQIFYLGTEVSYTDVQSFMEGLLDRYKQNDNKAALEFYLVFGQELFSDFFYDLDDLPEILEDKAKLNWYFEQFKNYYAYLYEVPLDRLSGSSVAYSDYRLDEEFTTATVCYVLQSLKDKEYVKASEAIEFYRTNMGLSDPEYFLYIETLGAVVTALQGNEPEARKTLTKWIWASDFDTIDEIFDLVEGVGIRLPIIEQLRTVTNDDDAFLKYSELMKDDLYFCQPFFEGLIEKLDEKRNAKTDSLEYLADTRILMNIYNRALNSDANLEDEYANELFHYWLRALRLERYEEVLDALDRLERLVGIEDVQFFRAFNRFYTLGENEESYAMLQSILETDLEKSYLKRVFEPLGASSMQDLMLRLIDIFEENGIRNDDVPQLKAFIEMSGS
jgi:WD40 repeat protein